MVESPIIPRAADLMICADCDTRAGKPPGAACSRTVASCGAIYIEYILCHPVSGN